MKKVKVVSQKPRERGNTPCQTLERILSSKIKIRLTINISLANLTGVGGIKRLTAVDSTVDYVKPFKKERSIFLSLSL